jgi:hypothetical protein
MTRRLRIAALAAVTALAITGCANNDAKRSDVVNAMSDSGLSDEQANCIGDEIDAAFRDDQDLYNDVAATILTDENWPEGTEDEINAALDTCLGDGGDGDTSETSDTTAGDEGEGGDTTETTAAG